jgi:uncharacterized membrane protein YgaE (UPF0421/DUF939 family)
VMKNRLIGMRTIKTALVVIISYIVSSLINEELSFALIYAAVICVETSVVSSVKIGYNRVLGTVIGGVIGLIMNYVPLYGGITMAIGIIITIMFTNLLNIKKATGIAITLVVIIIIGSADTSPAIYAMQRTLDTIIGIVIATLVNMVIYPPDQMRMVRESFEHFKHTAKEIVSEVILYGIDNGLATLTKELDDFREKYESLSKELKILKKYDMEDYEYYTQMIEASEKVLIYTEAISLSDPDVKMTADNNQKLTKILAKDMKQSEFVDLDSSTREDMIFNYNLAKLISALEKILRVRIVRTDQN